MPTTLQASAPEATCILPQPPPKDQSRLQADFLQGGTFCDRTNRSAERQNRVQIKAAYVLLQACPWVRLGSEDVVFVGLLGGPRLAQSARDRGRLLAPVFFPDPEDAVCEKEGGGVHA